MWCTPRTRRWCWAGCRRRMSPCGCWSAATTWRRSTTTPSGSSRSPTRSSGGCRIRPTPPPRPASRSRRVRPVADREDPQEGDAVPQEEPARPPLEDEPESPPLDEDAVWAALIAGFDAEPEPGTEPSWPEAENVAKPPSDAAAAAAAVD